MEQIKTAFQLILWTKGLKFLKPRDVAINKIQESVLRILENLPVKTD